MLFDHISLQQTCVVVVSSSCYLIQTLHTCLSFSGCRHAHNASHTCRYELQIYMTIAFVQVARPHSRRNVRSLHVFDPYMCSLGSAGHIYSWDGCVHMLSFKPLQHICRAGRQTARVGPSGSSAGRFTIAPNVVYHDLQMGWSSRWAGIGLLAEANRGSLDEPVLVLSLHGLLWEDVRSICPNLLCAE